ncbi:hypothetical protein PR202_ga28513 [Eleusine coracana subsp. coracana]|uniref:DUF1618 domain-containing protein n=1 Tax=Eleusine coracana subsp. coracana TaxID=191504 RepID=A0AAV5DJY3_ELECO|nr:hypothetical protein PR202_ga28513 [Eleusine coracana subsp. coracana]
MPQPFYAGRAKSPTQVAAQRVGARGSKKPPNLAVRAVDLDTSCRDLSMSSQSGGRHRVEAGNPFPQQALNTNNSRWIVINCRHGRVLIHDSRWLMVWDPITGDQHQLCTITGDTHHPNMPWVRRCGIKTGAVLCAVDGCDHIDCHDSPFRVVVLDTHVFVSGRGTNYVVWASVYSSETDKWSDETFLGENHYDLESDRPSLLIGDALYFTLEGCLGLLKYDLKDHACPITAESIDGWEKAQQFVMELGICYWSIKLVAVVEGIDTVFINSDVGLFTMNLKSRQVRKVLGHAIEAYHTILPYRSFYIPGFQTTPDAPRLALSLFLIRGVNSFAFWLPGGLDLHIVHLNTDDGGQQREWSFSRSLTSVSGCFLGSMGAGDSPLNTGKGGMDSVEDEDGFN